MKTMLNDTMLNDTEVDFLLPFVQKEIDELMKGDWDAVFVDVAAMHTLSAKLIRLRLQYLNSLNN